MESIRRKTFRGSRRPPGHVRQASGPETFTRPASPCPTPRSAIRRRTSSSLGALAQVVAAFGYPAEGGVTYRDVEAPR
jgi:hypothetical protein